MTSYVFFNKQEQFFYDNAGYGYDPATETPEDGKRRGAQLLAVAEEYAKDQGFYYEWVVDECIGHGDLDYNCCSESYACIMYADIDRVVVLQSLGSICEPTGQYRRVVEAELAAEEMPTRL